MISVASQYIFLCDQLGQAGHVAAVSSVLACTRLWYVWPVISVLTLAKLPCVAKLTSAFRPGFRSGFPRSGQATVSFSVLHVSQMPLAFIGTGATRH